MVAVRVEVVRSAVGRGLAAVSGSRCKDGPAEVDGLVGCGEVHGLRLLFAAGSGEVGRPSGVQRTPRAAWGHAAHTQVQRLPLGAGHVGAGGQVRAGRRLGTAAPRSRVVRAQAARSVVGALQITFTYNAW